VSEDGRPVLVPGRRELAGWHVFRDGPGIGVYWVGSWLLLARATQGLRQRRPEVRCGDEEGFLYLEACPALAGKLPWFSRRAVTDEQRARGKACREAFLARRGRVGRLPASPPRDSTPGTGVPFLSLEDRPEPDAKAGGAA
jgi:hypothetical protein